jgi:ascorbate-specific PTS system EIIC-type component UlaA
MGQHETSLFDLIAMLIPMQAAGVAAVFAFQWGGWGAAIMAPFVVTFAWIMIGVGIGRLSRARSGPSP